MIVLDTNLVSALMMESRNSVLVDWLDRQPRRTLVTTIISVYEIQRGIALLPDGPHRRRLDAAFEVVVNGGFQGRILPFDRIAALNTAELSATRTKRGFNIGWQDTMIAGIALAHDATIATSNVKDFRDLGARVVNPWEASSPS